MLRGRFEQLELRRLLTAVSSALPVLNLGAESQVAIGSEDEEIDVAILADMNADGIQDLVFSTTNDTNISVALNDAEAAFPHRMSIDFVEPLRSLAIGDFNGDELPDLAAVSSNLTSLYLNLGNDESNNWQGMALSDVLVAGGSSVAISDVNGDAIPDVVLGMTNNVRVAFANADGTLSSSTEYPAPEGDRIVRLADVDADGHVDIVSAVSQTSLISVHKNDGEGIFETIADDFNVGVAPTTFEIADVNGDEIPDIIVGHRSQEDGNLSIWHGTGEGTFKSEADRYSVFGPITGIGVADFDNDQVTDIVVSHDGTFHHPLNGNGPGGVSMLVGTQTGGFHEAIRVITKDMAASFLIDLDQDGLLDILGVHLAGGLTSKVVQREVGFGSSRADNYVFDSAPEILVLDTYKNVAPRMVALTNADDGTTVSLLSRNELGQFVATDEVTLVDFADRLISGDFDGDGSPDIAAIGTRDNSAGVTMLPISDSSFGEPVATSLENGVWSHFLATNLNADGRSDLVAVRIQDNDVQLFGLTNELGTFSSDVSTSIQNVSSMHSIDADGDEFLDIALATSNDVQIMIANGDGTFSATDSVVGRFPQFGDFNGDGNTDILVQSGFLNVTVSAAYGNGDATFQDLTEAAVHGSFAFAKSVDANGDGRTDFIIGDKVVYGDTVGFSEPVRIPTNFSSLVVAEDFTGRGTLDLMLDSVDASSVFAKLVELTGESDGTFSDSGERHARLTVLDLVSADVDQDSDPDTIIIHRGGFAILTNETIRVPGDLNFDGVADVNDVDTLCEHVGSSDATEIDIYDLNDDGQIDAADAAFFVESIFGTRAGDADLDGQVVFQDFLALAINFGRTDATWSQGDFDCNGEAGFLDFLILATNFGFKADETVAADESVPVAEAAATAEPPYIGAARIVANASILDSDDHQHEQTADTVRQPTTIPRRNLPSLVTKRTRRLQLEESVRVDETDWHSPRSLHNQVDSELVEQQENAAVLN